MAAHSDQLIGAQIVTVAVIALVDVGRATRFLNELLGVGGRRPLAGGRRHHSLRLNDAVAAALVSLLSVPRGTIGEPYDRLGLSALCYKVPLHAGALVQARWDHVMASRRHGPRPRPAWRREATCPRSR